MKQDLGCMHNSAPQHRLATEQEMKYAPSFLLNELVFPSCRPASTHRPTDTDKSNAALPSSVAAITAQHNSGLAGLFARFWKRGV